MKLTARQEKFCTEYIQSGNAAAAYRTAYGTTSESTAKTNGSKLLRNPAVQARLDGLQAEVTNEKICAAREVQERLSAIARRELSETVYLPNGEQAQRQTSIRDSCRALELLAKINGMFVAKQEIELNGNLPVIIRDDL